MTQNRGVNRGVNRGAAMAVRKLQEAREAIESGEQVTAMERLIDSLGAVRRALRNTMTVPRKKIQ